MPLLLQLNYALFQDINGHAGSHPWLDGLMIFCANYLIFCLPLIMLSVSHTYNLTPNTVAGHLPSHPAQKGQMNRSRALTWGRQLLSTFFWIGVACLTAYALNLLIEQVIFEPRPFVSHHVHQLVAHAADGSFPSDHTAWAFAVAGMFLLQWFLARRQAQHQKKALISLGVMTLLALVIGCVIGFARIYVGVHYPSDILGGALDGLIAASLITFLRSRLKNFRASPVSRNAQKRGQGNAKPSQPEQMVQKKLNPINNRAEIASGGQ